MRDPSNSLVCRGANIVVSCTETRPGASLAHRRRGVARLGAERGFALLIVLWSMVLMALLAIQLTAAGRTEAKIAANLRDAASAEAAADGAVHDALFRLLDPSARRLLADGAVRRSAIPRGVVDIRVTNDAGKVNPNTASPALLTALLHGVGADPATATSVALAIAAWRTPSFEGQGFAAVAAQYRAAGRDYAPPGAPFQSLDEIGLVLGMTPYLLAGLMPHLSLYTEDNPVPYAADPVVLQAMREAVFGDTLGSVAEAEATPVSVMSITATAHMVSGANFSRHAVVRMAPAPSGRPYQILAWESAIP